MNIEWQLFIVGLAVAMVVSVVTPARAAPPTQEAIVKACDDADSAAQCERVIETAQTAKFSGVVIRDGPVLRLPGRPGKPQYELRDAGDPENDKGADYRAHAFWDYWPEPRIAVVSVITRDSDYYLLLELDRAAQLKLPAEPLLSPDGRRFLVADFCAKACGNQIQVWRIERDRAIRERTFKPAEKWHDTEVSWRDPSTLAIGYSTAAPRRRLADPGELTLNRAKPIVLKLSDSDWVSDESRR